jgi:hypothetical protein
LLCQRKIVLTVDHRFALANPALLSARSKIVLQCQLTAQVTQKDAMSAAGHSGFDPNWAPR